MKKITLCADDYGQNQSISQAIITLLEKNRLSATSCMTTSPHWPEQAKWLHPLAGQADIGLHFNLTEGNPLSALLTRFLPLPQWILKAYARQLNQHAIEAELNAQLDAFAAAMGGKLPDFIDGHQHIHQLPVIRDALWSVYDKRLQSSRCYLRCVYDLNVCKSVKGLIIQLLGAYTFKKAAIQRQIPHNSSFSGVYSFQDSKQYRRYFLQFLAQIKDRGIIMCHPGLQVTEKTDVIAKARFDEFSYFAGNDFVLDCLQAGVILKGFVE